jgi:hypothetical protein
MKQANIIIDHKKKEIVVTKKFYEDASVFGSQEYNDLKNAMAAESDYKIRVKIKRNPDKKTYPNLTFKNMKKYIAYKEGADSPNIQTITKLIDSADIQTSRYAYVKSWFLENYPNYSDPDALLEGFTEKYPIPETKPTSSKKARNKTNGESSTDEAA